MEKICGVFSEVRLKGAPQPTAQAPQTGMKSTTGHHTRVSAHHTIATGHHAGDLATPAHHTRVLAILRWLYSKIAWWAVVIYGST
mgnify:CR=1 FL=1